MTEDQGTAVARRDHDPELDLTEIVLDGPLENMAQAWAIAKVLSRSSMVPHALRGSPQNCFVTMMLGQELGLTWTQATRGIYVLPNGTPGLRGQLLLAKIRAAGHRYTFERGDNWCKCTITRGDEDHKVPYEGTFNLEDALAAHLVTEKDGKYYARSTQRNEPLPWEMYRSDMLQWRAVARATAIGAPEVIYGFDIAGIGGVEESGTPVIAASMPAPAPAQADDTVRDKLAELDEQASGAVRDRPAARNDTTARHQHAVADYDASTQGSGDDDVPPGDGESTQTDPSAAGAASTRGAQRSSPPDLNDLSELLKRCGYRINSAQVTAVSALVHREISSLSALTPAEILMAHGAITRAIIGMTKAEQRHDALATVIAAELDVMDSEGE